MAGSSTTADGITSRGSYAYAPPASFFAEGAVPAGAGVFNATAFGAVADPNVDNRAAIQSAIDAAAAAGGGVVYIPPGIYGIGADPAGSGGLEIKSNVYIKGGGMDDTVLRVLDGTDDSISGIIRSPGGENTDNYGVADLTLDGNRANTDPAANIDGFNSGGTPGGAIMDSDVTLLRVEAQNCSGDGFDTQERVQRILIDSCEAHHNGKDGFVAGSIVDGEFRGNLAWANARHGFNVATTTNDFLIEDNTARNNEGAGIVVQRGTADIPVPHNIVIRGNTVSGNAREGVLIQMAENVLIADNVISGSGRIGLRLYGADNVTAVGNTILNSGQSLHDEYAAIQIKEYDDRLGLSGLLFGAHDNLVRDNRIGGSSPIATRYGVEEADGNVGGNVIAGNAIADQVRGIFKLFAGTTVAGFRGTFRHENIAGAGGSDRFFGGLGDDTLKGFAGDDLLDGGAGVDAMTGGLGDDIFVVDNAGDGVTELAGEGIDTVRASVSLTLKADFERLILTGGGAITGKGNDGANQIWGNNAANALNGAGGDDTIAAGGGDDTLTGGGGRDRSIGGLGADIFKFLAVIESGTGAQADVVLDFSSAQGDRVNLSGLDASTAAGDQDPIFIGTMGFDGTRGLLRFRDAAGGGWLELDSNGDRAADFAIRLMGVAWIATADLIL